MNRTNIDVYSKMGFKGMVETKLLSVLCMLTKIQLEKKALGGHFLLDFGAHP